MTAMLSPLQEDGVDAPDSCKTIPSGLSHLDNTERKRHACFIESLAEEMQRSVDDIVPLYQEVLEALAAEALVNDYLPIFVYRRVKRILSGSSFPS
jgi:hypothetical protein